MIYHDDTTSTTLGEKLEDAKSALQHTSFAEFLVSMIRSLYPS